MKDTFLQSIREEYPNELVTRLVFADWCMENEPNLENKLRIHFPIIDGLNINPYHGYLYGYGYGYGSGNGDGFGPGYGSGFGPGLEPRRYQNITLNMPKLHTNQLVFLPYSFVCCGYIQENIQPYQFKITNASIIIYHNSSWHAIANNMNRNIRIEKIGTITIGPQIFHSIDWEGDLP